MMTSSSNHMFVYGLASTFISYVVILDIFKHILMGSGLPLHFVIEPKSAFLSNRSGVTLDCGTEPGSADIQWYFNGSLMTASKQEVKGINRSRLNLTLDKDLGFFHCVASNSDGAIRSLPAFVSGAYLNDFGAGLFDRTIEVIENNTAVIPCATPAGQPSTMTEFEINSTRLLPTARHLVLPSGNLQISKVRMEDSGMYRCTAVNPLTGERRHAPTTVMLKVTEFTGLIQPWFTWTPRSHLEVVQGQNLTLECAVEGWPVPQLNWKRYGGVLPKDRSTTIWGNLMIKRVQKSDEGTYICRAEVNTTHSQDHVAFIDVLEPPMVTMSSSEHNATQFDTVTLVCHVTGSPVISVHWYHNALPVVTSQEIIVSPNGSLTLLNVQLHNGGMYQCFAENSVGVSYASARLTVSVRESGVDVNSLPQDEMQDVATNNDRVTSEMLRPSGTRKLKKLQKNSSSRAYSTSSPDVVTESEFSPKARVEDEVNSQATLLPPSKPSVAMASDTSVLLNWTVIQNGSLPVVFFKVQYKEIVDNKKSPWKTLDEEIPLSSRSYEVLALKSGAVYQFRIAAVYSNQDNKFGPTSDRVVLETGLSSSGRPRVPVSSPMIVNVHEDITSFIVSWQYKPSERVTVDGFKIFYKPYDDDVDYQSIVVMGPGVRKATVADLKPYTIYSIHMSCFNSDGESIPSLSVARTTLGLFGSSADPSYEKEILDPIDGEQAAVTTTTAVFTYYATNRNNTHASNELLFVVLGVVLGIMILGLCVVMVMCACKQHQQRRLFAALDGHRRFHDPSRAIYIGSQMKSPAEGNFLLNGVGAAPKKPTANGYLSVFGNGAAPEDSRPTSEHKLGGNTKAERNREVPLRVDQDLPGYDKLNVMKAPHILPLTDDRQMGRDPTSLPESSGHAAASYHPPKDLPTMSRPRDVPFHSLKPSRMPCDHRLHGNDVGELCPPFQAAASPDHIPRLHECQLLYRSPEHTRRSRDQAQRPRHEQVSDRSLSASSQVSGADRLRPRLPGAEIEPHAVGCSKIANILPVELHSSDDADGHSEDGGASVVDDLGRLTEDGVIPVRGRISRDGRLSQSQSDCRRSNSDCPETVELFAPAHSVTHGGDSNPRENS